MSKRFEMGVKSMNQLGENRAQSVLDLFNDIAPDFAVHLIECFGDFFTRSKLTLREREMITIASITTLGYAPDRLKTHIQGALNVGVKPHEIIEIIMQISYYAGFPAAVNAMLVVKEVFQQQNIQC